MGSEAIDIMVREVTPDDEHFLFMVYASTRDEELSATGWDENQKLAFIKMQYLVRQRAYPKVDDRIILKNGHEIGRILVDRNEAEIVLRDIALLTGYRNAGIGSYLIKELMKEAAACSKPLRLHVLETSPAVRLYERLGFVRSGYDAAYLEMTWIAATPSSI